MTVINWNPLVNKKIYLDGEYGLKEGYVQELKFESGKERAWLKNSFAPRVFPSLKLILDNKVLASSGKTEYEEFNNWYNKSLRYGVLPFQITRLGYKRKWDTKTDEMGIYKFLPNSIKYDSLDGYVFTTFGLEETGIIPEKVLKFLAAKNGGILLTKNKKMIIAKEI
jgi:hypothetical protein